MTPAHLASFPSSPVRPTRSVLDALSPDNGAVLVIAHRGVFDTAPENSVAALERAVALGVDMMEFDTQRSADGTLVVIHDDTLDRTTTGAGPVGARTLAELRDLRLREGEGGPDNMAAEERIPLLSEMLEAARGRILLNIDAKHRADLPEIARIVHDLGLEDEVLIKAEIDPFAYRAPSAGPWRQEGLAFMPMFRFRSGEAPAQAAAIVAGRPPMIECHFDHIDALWATHETLAAAGTRLWVNSLDCSHSLDFSDSNAHLDPDRIWGVLLAAGVGAIQTDRAEDLIAWLGARHASAAR